MVEAGVNQAAVTEQRTAAIRAALSSGEELTIGHIGRRAGLVWSSVTPLMKALVRSGEVVHTNIAGKSHYRRAVAGETAPSIPRVKQIELSAVTAPELDAAIAALLSSGASYSLDELQHSVRKKLPAAIETQVQQSLDRLMDVGALERFELGSRARYRKCAEPAVSA